MNQFSFPGGIANDDPCVIKPPANPPPVVCLVGIDYDEFKPDTYRGCFVIVSENGVEREKREFAWWDQAEAFALSQNVPVLHLSSVDDYAADLKRPSVIEQEGREPS